MDESKQILISTHNKNNNCNIIDDSSFKKFKYPKNNNYLILIGKSSDNRLIIKIKTQSELKINFFQNIYTLEELHYLDKSFRSFDTIDEALSGFISILESNKYDLEFKEYEKIFLILKIQKFGKGEQIVNIEMKKNLFSFQNICQNLIKKINNLDKQMNDLVKEINILKEENKKKELIINELKEWKEENKKKYLIINELKEWKDKMEKEEKEKEKEEKEKEEKERIKAIIDSKIIEKKEELILLINRLRKNTNFNNFSFKLIFRGTKDGKYSKDFHRKCDGIGKTISIIKTIKGYKFGGYAEKPWCSEGYYWITDDENAFVFSLNHMKVYNPVYGKYKYYWGKNSGPMFSSFFLHENMFSESGNYIDSKNTANKFFSGFGSDYELNGGERNFIIQEIEVFQIVLI